MSEWNETTISEIIEEHGGSIKTGPFGTVLKAHEYTENGVPLISVREIGYGIFSLGQHTPRVPPKVTDRLPEYLLETGDIVFGRKGAVDRSAIVQPEQHGWFLGSDGIRLRLPSICHSLFVAYHFQAASTRSWLLQHATGTTMASLNQKIVGRVPITLPPLPDQRAIASVLGALDDKIELNRRMNKTLEDMAAAIFKAWFVDFEPVHAKANGAKSFPGMPPKVFATLPKTFIDSELGQIPEGWAYVPATDIASVAIGKTPPRKESHWFTEDPKDTPWVSIRDMGRCGVFANRTSEYLTKEAIDRHNVRYIPDRSVLVSFKLTLGRVVIADGVITSNEAIAHFVPHDSETIGTEFLYCYLSAFDYNMLGSTSSIGTATNSKVIKAMPILNPSRDVAKAFRYMAKSIFQTIHSLELESQTLAETRDTLLPKLLSGEVRVCDLDLQEVST